ncbi:outer membrane protein [Helicobacter cetorum]|uniref:Outer membrane protein HopF, putative signal peptide n=1 Tax=Helicobacter cetorum (strain ATCC BAA-540 / CCUG 52418 / MIT 99-5656) TaxID=1163745 RepID=I0ERG6_HELCM|nr:outer membrane protein [Helicobacter cetorum]AFI05535.1 Outer membrane protein HopF, putative signal peptide [Helicobacter cetorum MIT 99-5656]
MKNYPFKKMIALSLMAGACVCNAEEDGAFFVIDYQTSLARQELRNPGFTQAQSLRRLMKDGAVRLQTSAAPLAYYLDILGNKTKGLLGNNGSQSSQSSGSSQHNEKNTLDSSLRILGDLLNLAQKYAAENIIKPLVVEATLGSQKTQVNITEAMLLVAQSITSALGQVGLTQGTQQGHESSGGSSSDPNLYSNLMKVMLLGVGGSDGKYNGVSIGDVATGMQKFASQATLIGSNSTIKEINALVKSGVSLALETKALGDFIERSFCSGGNCFSSNTETSYQGGLARSKKIVGESLAQFESASKSLYKISYIPNLSSLKDDQSASMNGFGAKMGYKQFFTNKKNIGLRYYGFLDYGFANFGDANLKVNANLVTYGVGTDFLYNVFERSKRREKTTIGFFFGTQLAGQTWSSNVTSLLSGEKPSVNSTSFQFLFDLGVRTNFAKTKMRSHRLDQGIEFGVKIPVIAHKYFTAQGSSASYMRNFSFYVGYSVGF